MSIDSAVACLGRKSLRATYADSADFASGATRIPLSGKTPDSVGVRGFIKSEDVTLRWAGLFLGVYGNSTRPLAFDNMIGGAGAHGTSDWTQYEIRLPVADEAVSVTYGVIHAGHGTAWFDAVELFAVGGEADDGSTVFQECEA